MTTAVAFPGSAANRLQCVMLDAGWHIDHVELDLTTAHPKADIALRRADGFRLHAKVDSLGRASIESSWRTHSLGMSASTKGRRPLSRQVEERFMGRSQFPGARSMLRGLTERLADNAVFPVRLADVRSAWAAIMNEPLRIERAA